MQMDNDIVPALLETIEQEFDKRRYNSKKLRDSLSLLRDKQATYLDVNDFAIELGEILADVLGNTVTSAALPDGKMYYNIAERVLNQTLKKNYQLISNFAVDVQTQLNKAANISIKGQFPVLNQSRIDGIVERVSTEENFEEIKWILDDPIVNFSQSIVDDAIKTNAEFHAKSGLSPKLTRRVAGHACEWCRNLAGTYDYYEAPDDIYRRHQRCRCTVDYRPGDGKRQNVWSKGWAELEKNQKISKRKSINIADIKSNNRVDDRNQFKEYIELLGAEKMPVSLAKFQDLKYNDSEKYEQLLDQVVIQRNFKSGKWLDKINVEKQARHIQSTVADGKSYFYDHVDVESLYQKYKQTGFISTTQKGNKTSNEKVDLFEKESLGIDIFTGKEINSMTIKYSKTGVHLIPTYYERGD